MEPYLQCRYTYVEPFLHANIPYAMMHLLAALPAALALRRGSAAELPALRAVGNAACSSGVGSARALHRSGACLGCCRAGCRPAPRAQSPAVLRHEARRAAGVPGRKGGCARGRGWLCRSARAGVPGCERGYAGVRGRVCQAALQLGWGFGIWKRIPAARQTLPEPGAGSGRARAAATANQSRVLTLVSPTHLAVATGAGWESPASPGTARTMAGGDSRASMEKGMQGARQGSPYQSSAAGTQLLQPPLVPAS